MSTFAWQMPSDLTEDDNRIDVRQSFQHNVFFSIFCLRGCIQALAVLFEQKLEGSNYRNDSITVGKAFSKRFLFQMFARRPRSRRHRWTSSAESAESADSAEAGRFEFFLLSADTIGVY